MSIVVLKAKSRRWQAPISGQGEYGFSLNGTRRNIGVIGSGFHGKIKDQSIKTRFRGDTAMGSGGCCGAYKKTISNSGSGLTNDSHVVKRSVGNTRGLINQTLTFGRQTIQAAPGFEGLKTDLSGCRCPDGGGFYAGSRNIVKNPLWMTANDYIVYNLIAKYSGSCGYSGVTTDFKGERRRCEHGDNLSDASANLCKSTTPGSNYIGTRRLTNKCRVTKVLTGNATVDMGTYLRGLVYKKHCLPQFNGLPYTKYNRMPIPEWINNKACGKTGSLIINPDDAPEIPLANPPESEIQFLINAVYDHCLDITQNPKSTSNILSVLLKNSENLIFNAYAPFFDNNYYLNFKNFDLSFYLNGFDINNTFIIISNYKNSKAIQPEEIKISSLSNQENALTIPSYNISDISEEHLTNSFILNIQFNYPCKQKIIYINGLFFSL